MRSLLILLLITVGATAQTPPIEPGVSHELAKWRAARYSDVRYKLNLTLEKMSPVLKGTMEIRVKVSEPHASAGGQNGNSIPPIILDWRKIKGFEDRSTLINVSINGRSLNGYTKEEYVDSAPGEKIYIEQGEHLIFQDRVVPGENVIKLDFTSPILTSGSAITRYVDKEDGAEYIYSLFVPSDASTAFPVFDQPDLKARFSVDLYAPFEWETVSNTLAFTFDQSQEMFGRQIVVPPGMRLDRFPETKPISTYVFAFAAGPFERVPEPVANVKAELKDAMKNAQPFSMIMTTDEAKEWKDGRLRGGLRPAVPPTTGPSGSSPTLNTSIFVRKSQLPKFKPHAAEAFRLNREGIKYLEQYFDYKFPFPKYDLVLIPEFPFGGMEHAGATFLRESSIIFPTEPTKSDYISRANLIFHEAAHQWFGDTVTMKWFDDLWLKEGFAEFMAYKTLERVMPEANAWKVFYERNKQAAYLTDSTRGTTPIYQKIDNLSSAKSAYGNIVYRKAPSFLKQAEFYLGADKFQTAVRTFLKKHEYGNAGWEDLVQEFEVASGQEELRSWWARPWVHYRGMPIFDLQLGFQMPSNRYLTRVTQRHSLKENLAWTEKTRSLIIGSDGRRTIEDLRLSPSNFEFINQVDAYLGYTKREPKFVFPNYEDYGYGIFLLDDKSRVYVLKNIGSEKDAFLRSMMWGALWDSVREGELDPAVYVELAIKNLPNEQDETIGLSILSRVSTATNYYIAERVRDEIAPKLESLLLERIMNSVAIGQRITFYRAFLNTSASAAAKQTLKDTLTGKFQVAGMTLKAKDKFDIVQRLIILGDQDALKLLADLEKTETTDDGKRYAYAARAGIATAENKAKYWNDFVNNKDISESWIEAAFGPWNSIRHADRTLPYLQKALQELPNHKRNRKIFFVNGWLGAFIGGQRSDAALAIVNKFLADNPNLDKDLRLKILENVDLIERAVKIRGRFGKN